MQVSKFLESNTKFSFKNHRATENFEENTFAKWSNNNFYRTSTQDMSCKVINSASEAFLLTLHFTFDRVLNPDRPL